MKHSLKNLISVLAGCAALLAPTLSQAWWNADWTARKKVTLETGKTGADVSEPVANLPILLRLHSGNFNFLDAKEDGSDIRFVAGDDKTALKFHFEKYDAINELALVWVQLPLLSADANTSAMWIYSSNPKVGAAPDAKGTYDVNYVAIYHFDEKTGSPVDQTAYANNPSPNALTRDATGLIGSGLRLGGGDKLIIPTTPSLAFGTDGFTFSAWIKLAAANSNAMLFDARSGATGVSLFVDHGQLFAKSGAVETPHRGAITPNAWHHVAVVAGKRLAVYLDGEEISATNFVPTQFNAAVTVGTNFVGVMDEMTISNIARGAAWVKALSRSQSPDFKVATYGGDERSEGGGTSYFSTILHSVTLDGWVVIFILIIMAAVSWVVMIGKAMVIKRASEDNLQFLESYKRMAADMGVLDRNGDRDAIVSPFATALFGPHQHFESSPLYSIYHVGIQEIKQRFGRTDPAKVGKILSPQSLGAIRASLDAAQVREQQKLNRQMVLLTIAISGGPFLGLLGTVVGVMITFAAIAASGDVNVNAIAPGIAAALVATVAGLGVAIPALFGYNYLITRIKSMSADMNVFVDEFVHKVAEVYGT